MIAPVEPRIATKIPAISARYRCRVNKALRIRDWKLSYTPYMDSSRNFLGKVASGLAGTLAAVPAQVLGANERVRVGIIGFGDRGAELMNHVRACPGTSIAGVSDIFVRQLDKSRSLAPEAAVYLDYRRLLDDPT